MSELEKAAMDLWRREWGEDPSGPLYGTGDTLEERWRSLSNDDRRYYTSCAISELRQAGQEL